MSLEAGPQHANPMGTLHGGILCDLADGAMGMAFFTTCQEGETFTTLELKINFLRPVRMGLLVATGRRPGWSPHADRSAQGRVLRSRRCSRRTNS